MILYAVTESILEFPKPLQLQESGALYDNVEHCGLLKNPNS